MSEKQTKAEKQAAFVSAIREDILARLNVDTDTGAFTTSEGDDAYVKHMPEGVTPELAKAVHDYNTNFAAAGAGAVVKKATEAFGTNADLKQVNHEIGMHGKDKLQVMINRENGLSVAMTTTIVNAKAGPLKSVFAEFNEAMDAMGKED